jgi:cell division inhibitor SulA/protein ImuA
VDDMQVPGLEQLERDGLLWRGERQRMPRERLLPSGWRVLDDVLGGGWPRAAVTEILSDGHQGLSLLLPALARLSAEPRWLAWIMPPYVPYAPALAARGIRVDRVLLVQQVAAEQALWAVEQALKSGGCGIVLAWPDRLQPAQLRRLQLAAERGDCPALLFRPVRVARQASPAALRLRARPAPLGLEFEVLKRRGGRAGGRCIVPLDAGQEA